ncbi:YheC/YheD family protein [Brevibacillus ginsengisoli]|uniref:YheC/YheD family protein n=1 Tax=Brevibacillus ginsengisoli TaxID=363854 RepID=UPI003CE6F138
MSKWERYSILNEDMRIRSYLPETRLMSEQNLRDLLAVYESVILKPAAASGGVGVMIVSSLGNDHFEVQIKLEKQVITRDDLFSYLTKEIIKDFASFIPIKEVMDVLSESYIIQHRIPLAQVDHRPFDIRVMVQRKVDSPWVVTGKLAKLADSGYAITNVNLGAVILPVETVLQRSPSLQALPEQALLAELDHVALLATERLAQHFQIRMVGYDLCLDNQGKVWIIEANFRPDDYIFLDLEDKTMYETIRDYS